MKYIVLKDTFDLKTKEPIKKGTILTLTKKRALRGIELGLIEEYKTEKVEK